MRILLTGRNGQVGWELERALPALGEVIATDRSTLDLADPDAIRRVVREAKPQVIVNAAAYTAVDRAESEPELAETLNARAPGVLAEEARRIDALLVHYSTDYVFDGKEDRSYVEEDQPCPLNVYGRTKLSGEAAIGASGAPHVILRTSWVYGPRGRNFLLTVLRKARAGEALRVVNDQVGAPTSSPMIAEATVHTIERVLADRSLCGLYHMTSAGSTSWHGFTQALLEASGLSTLVEAISSEAYPSAARRPRNSILNNTRLARRLRLQLPAWQAGMSKVLSALREAER